MRKLTSISFCILAAACIPVSGSSVTVTGDQQQTIKGWGVFGGYHRLSDWGLNAGLVSRPDIPGSIDKNNILDALWLDLGVSIGRVDLAPTYYDAGAPDKVNTYRITDLVKHLQAAQSRGVSEYLVSVWSPPAALKVPARVEGSFWRLSGDGVNKVSWFPGIQSDPAYEKVTTSLRTDMEAEFVSYYAKAIQYLTTQGLAAPVAVSLQNEPRWAPEYDACLYGGTQYHRVAIALRAALDAEGLTGVKLIGPEHNDYGDKTWGNPIMYINWSALGKNASGTPNALAAALQGTATHSYDLSNPGWDMDYINEYANALARLKTDFPSWDFWATEHSIDFANSLTEIELTQLAIRQFNREIATLPHHYWFWWQGYNSLADAPGHLQALLSGSDSALNKTKLYHVFSRLWKSAPKGSIVRKVTSDHPSILASGATKIDLVAFEKADSHTVLLVCNPTTSAQSLNLAGLTGSIAKVYRTTSTEDMVAQPDLPLSSGGASYDFPPESIVVFDCEPNMAPISPYKGWAQTYFAELPGGVENALAAFGADYDTDGFSNGIEYALGTTPNLAMDGPANAPAIVAGDFTFLVADPFPTDLSLVIEGCDTLGGWQPIASRFPGQSWIGPVTEADEGTHKRITLPLSTEPNYFYRLRASLP